MANGYPTRSARASLRIAALLLLGPGAAGAQTWRVEYDPSLGTLPSAQGFTHSASDPAPADGLNEGNYLVALGALTQGDTGGGNSDEANQQIYTTSTPAFDFEDDVIVVDLRLKLLSGTMTEPSQGFPGAGFTLGIVDAHGGHVRLAIGATGAFVQVGNGLPTTPVESFDTTADFVDYQIRIDRHRLSFRVDGTEVSTRDRDEFWDANVVGSNELWFGDGSTVHSSSSQIERLSVARFVPPAMEVHDYAVVTQSSATDSSSTKSLTVACPPGTNALAGGVTTIGADGSVGISETRPTGGPPATSWTGSARELVATGASWQLEVQAVCGEVSGYEVLTLTSALTTDRSQTASLACGERRSVIGGGARTLGTGLQQGIVVSRRVASFVIDPAEWSTSAIDYGAGATSSGAWGLEVYTICSDALNFEYVTGQSPQDGVSPKQAAANCPTGKVPIGGAGSVVGHSGSTGQNAAIRFSEPKEGVPGEPPVGWFAMGQATASLWTMEVTATCAPIADPTVSKNGIRGRWEGEFGAYDSWHARHGTLENGVGFEPGIRGQAFDLAAASQQWVQIPNTLQTDDGSWWVYPERSFTADAWIVTDTLAPDPYTAVVNLFDAGGVGVGTANCSVWQINVTSLGVPLATVRPANQGCVSDVLTGTTDVADGQPHHLAFSRDIDTRKVSLYVDGVLEVDKTITLMLTDGPLVPSGVADPVAIGIWRDAGTTSLSREFEGLIDDVKYYDRALSLEEVQNIAGCGLPVVPRVLNLDAAVFGNPTGGDHDLCVFLEAGQYELTLVDPGADAAARFTAWSPAPGQEWGTLYAVEPEIASGFTFGLAVSADSAQEAFDDTLDKDVVLTLAADQRVHFSIPDVWLLDSRGGVSIRVEPVPEPARALLLASGLGMLGWLARRGPCSSRPTRSRSGCPRNPGGGSTTAVPRRSANPPAKSSVVRSSS